MKKHFLFRFTESGIIQFWFREINYRYGQSYMRDFFDTKIERLNEADPLIVNNIASAFYLLLLGLSISSLIFLMEIFINKTKLIL